MVDGWTFRVIHFVPVLVFPITSVLILQALPILPFVLKNFGAKVYHSIRIYQTKPTWRWTVLCIAGMPAKQILMDLKEERSQFERI